MEKNEAVVGGVVTIGKVVKQAVRKKSGYLDGWNYG